MYLAHYVQLQAKYADDALENFNVAVQAINFRASQAAADHINGVIRSDTEGLIDNLVSPDSLDSLTVFMIVNAIYFKGAWQTKFLEADTAPADFHTLSGATKTVQMMKHADEKFSVAYLDDLGLDAEALALPYQGEDVVMLVLLPYARDGIHAMERGLNNISLTDVLDRTLATPAVKRTVHIPKFKLEADLNLEKQLPELGMTDLFTKGIADLTGIVEGRGNLYVSSAVHKAWSRSTRRGRRLPLRRAWSLSPSAAVRNPSSSTTRSSSPSWTSRRALCSSWVGWSSWARIPPPLRRAAGTGAGLKTVVEPVLASASNTSGSGNGPE